LLSFAETPLYYHSYLGLDKLLTSQQLMSAPAVLDAAAAAAVSAADGEVLASATPSSSSSSSSFSSPPGRCPAGMGAAAAAVPNNTGGAHDEHLFIIIHQAFELWFKQVLWELDDVRRLMNQEYVPERCVAQVICRLTRIGEIFRLLVDQFTILETMSPLGFLEFRDYLFPASGFQSLQWRKIEQGLGLEAAARADYGERKFCAFLNAEHQKELRASKEELPSLHDLVGRWLERPFAGAG
jgi:tryptophan 2,3-dioxygenase